MPQYDNTNSGLLARNERKESEKHPDLTGTINIEGKEYWLSAWSKRGKSGKLEGKPFFSISVKPKDAQHERPKTLAEQSPDEFNDDIPF